MNKKAIDIAPQWLHKTPNWLRWIFFIPAGIFGMIVSYTVFNIGFELLTQGSFWYKILQVPYTFFISFLSIVFACCTAPRWQLKISFILFVLLLVFISFVFYATMMSNVISMTENIIFTLTFVFGGAFGVYWIQQKQI